MCGCRGGVLPNCDMSDTNEKHTTNTTNTDACSEGALASTRGVYTCVCKQLSEAHCVYVSE